MWIYLGLFSYTMLKIVDNEVLSEKYNLFLRRKLTKSHFLNDYNLYVIHIYIIPQYTYLHNKRKLHAYQN